jgi:hypothetical protein
MDDDMKTTVDRLTAIAMEKVMAEIDAGRAAPPALQPPTTEQQLHAARFRERVTEAALSNGVRAKSIRHVLRDAENVFELKDDQLVPKQGATDPGDPCAPLSPAAWLRGLKQENAALFENDRRAD